MPKIILTPEESENYFHTALCNGSYFASYGKIHYSTEEYNEAKFLLKAVGKDDRICYEDVLLKMLKSGFSLHFVCNEGAEYNKSITLKDVHKKVKLTPLDHLNDMINENDDAVTADVILQTVFFGEVIFG